MYGLDSKDQLLGNTWRQLYDEAEVERFEAETFPALEADGYWSGRVTGTRPDGSQFPAELSLTIIGDGRLVCTVRDTTEQEQRTQQLEEFQRAVESAEDGVAVLDGDEYEYVDQTHVDMYGLDSKDQLLGNTWRRLYDEAEIERLEAEAFPALESDGYWRGMVTGTRPDGSQFPAELSLTIVDDGRLVCTVRDETERQARKRELETRSAAIEAASDGIALLDGDGQYTYVNQANAEIYGYDSTAAFSGEGWQMCYGATECARFESEILPQVTEHGEWRGEATGTRQDGTTFRQELSITSLEDGFICVVRDITERRARQQELELKERAMDEATVGIQIADATAKDNPLVYVNDGFERITGYDAGDIIGENPRFLQGDTTDEATVAKLRESIDAEQSVSVELQNQREDGTLYWNKLSITPVRDDEGTVTNYIGIQQDVTDRHRRLEQLEAQRERLDLTLSGTNTGIADWDLTNSTVSWSETLVEQLSRDIETFDEFEELVHPDDRHRVENQLEQMLETGEPWVGDLRVRHADGTYLWQGVRAVPTYDDSGTPVRVLTTVTDITERKQRQQQLDRERERFKLLIESIDEYAFVFVDGGGVIQTWNAGASDLFGYDTETATGMSMGQLHPESDRESGLPDRLLQQARIAGESAHEGWRVRADGSQFYADVRYAPLETDDGEFHGYAKVVRDMTEKRRQRRRTERFVEESEDVVTILDPDGTLTYASGSTQRVFGYDPDALVGENLFDYLHPDGREHAMETFFSCVEESESVTTECRLKAPDGEWFNIEGRCRNMLDDDAIGGILVYLRDVTERKERARRFEGIFNQTFQFTGLLEADGTVLEVNDAALEFGGLAREDVAGQPFQEVSWWTHSEASRESVTTALDRAARGNFVRYEVEVMGTEGLRTIDFSVKPVLDDDGGVSLLVVEGRDITDQQQRGQHLAVLERVMRHNIRNDLTKLRGWTQMLYEAGDDARREETYGTLQRILDKWEKMTERTQEINQLLDAQALHESHRSLTAIVDETVERAHASNSDTDITVDVDNGADVAVPSVLTDAIDELLSNAVAVSDDGPVTIRCRRPDSTWLELTIDDSGPGLPDAEAEVLESGEETALSHGQGLGLWFVRMVVTEIGGSLSTDVGDDGTAITLRIPTESADTEVSTDQ
jgi:PAS domain S-box-containing protein